MSPMISVLLLFFYFFTHLLPFTEQSIATKAMHNANMSQSSPKMDKGEALKILKFGMDSLVKLADLNSDGNVTEHEAQKVVSLMEQAWACTNLQSCTVAGWKGVCMEVKGQGNCTTTKGTTECEKSSRKVCAKLKVDTHKWYASVVPTEVCAELRELSRKQCTTNGTQKCTEMDMRSQRVCARGGLIGGCVMVDSLDACAKACTNTGGTKEECAQMCACTNSQVLLEAMGDALGSIKTVLNVFGLAHQ